MKTVTTTVMWALTAILAGCAAAPQPARQASAEDGARIWRTTCSMCHNARPASEFDPQQWTVIVNHMRTHAELSRTDAAAVAAFLSAAASDQDSETDQDGS